jgi:Putative Flp pilus-assembly TadE/G-like
MDRQDSSLRRRPQQGQAFLIIVLLIAFFLLAVLGLATDYTQVWAHRQMAQGAADAACQAGAADVFLKGTDPNASTDFPNPPFDFSWIDGSTFDCSARPNSVPCKYASFNGYSGSNVSVSFPSSLPGVSGIPSGFGTITNPYLKVTVTDPVATYFTRIASSIRTVNVTASAGCGLQAINAPVPLVVLHRAAAPSLQVTGTATITVLGGPQRSIQVDSNSPTAVSAGTVDLSTAGPNSPPTGADFAVFGGPTAKPTGVNVGSTGHWIPGANPFGDPFASTSAPTRPTGAGSAKPVTYKTNGCPDTNGCIEYSAGDYTSCSTGSISYGANGCLVIGNGGGSNSFTTPANRVPGPVGTYSLGNAIKPFPTANNAGGYTFEATSVVAPGHASSAANNTIFWPQTVGATQVDGNITWTNVGLPPSSSNTAIFDPGLYYLGDSHGLQLRAHAMVRPSTATGDGSLGTMFYFATAKTLSFGANSGSESIDTYHPDGSTNNGVTSPALKCPSGSAIPSQVTAAGPIAGNVLLGPCGGTSGIGATGQYGSPDGNRGFLFFQSRTNAANGGSCTGGFGGNCAILGGGAGFIFSGFIYLHIGNGGTCGTDTSCLSLAGGSGGNSFTIGNIVVDKLSMVGNSGVKMILNPLAKFSVLRPTLLQ